MKDAKGHGSDAHSSGVQQVGKMQPGTKMLPSGQKQVTIKHQDGEYAIPNGVGHAFENDKEATEGTARAIHGKDIVIKHRAASWGAEMD